MVLPKGDAAAEPRPEEHAQAGPITQAVITRRGM
jgi:hypothetical protein